MLHLEEIELSFVSGEKTHACVEWGFNVTTDNPQTGGLDEPSPGGS